jgi:hypothetical protein
MNGLDLTDGNFLLKFWGYKNLLNYTYVGRFEKKDVKVKGAPQRTS